MNMRPYETRDLDAVLCIFQDAINLLAADLYTVEQRHAWAHHLSPEMFDAKLCLGTTLVLEDGGGLAAFAQLHPSNHINYLYTHPRCARKGYASKLLTSLETTARHNGVKKLSTEASLASRPCFEAHGFNAIEEDRVERHGVQLQRWIMEKRLGRVD